MGEFKNVRFQTEKLPPEGGWGYIVMIGLAIPIACGLGSLSSFGLMFNDFIISLGGATSSVTIINGSFFSAISFAGLFSSTLSKKFSMRNVGVFGSVIYTLGSFMTIFATSVEHLIVSFGVLEGVGLGLMFPVFFTTFNQYFVKRRVFILNVAQSLIGIGTMIYPLMVEFLMKTFGFRGTIAIIAAINAHTICAMLVMHPVEWHFKVVQIPVNVTHLLIDSSKEKSVKINVMSNDEFEESQLPTYKNRVRLSIPDENMNNVDSLKSMKYERSKSLDPTRYADFEEIKYRMPSLVSLGVVNGAVALSENCESGKNTKWQKMVDFLDLTLLKDMVYLNIVLGISFALLSDNAFFTLQPMYLFELGFSKTDAAIIIAAGAAADLSSRIFLAIMSICVQFKARYVYLAGAIATILIRFVFLSVFDFGGLVLVTAIMGFFRTWVHVPLPLVFGEYLPQERFASGYGLVMFLQGNLAFLIGPFIGWIRDVTQSYIICFHSLTFIMALCAVPWVIEMAWLRMYHRRNNSCDSLQE